MDDTKAASIKKLLQSEDSALKRILVKVELLQRLNEIFHEEVDPKFRKHCTVANLQFEKLVVVAQNASIATQFRFSVPDLLPRLQKHRLLEHIKIIDCKVGLESG